MKITQGPSEAGKDYLTERLVGLSEVRVKEGGGHWSVAGEPFTNALTARLKGGGKA